MSAHARTWKRKEDSSSSVRRSLGVGMTPKLDASMPAGKAGLSINEKLKKGEGASRGKSTAARSKPASAPRCAGLENNKVHNSFCFFNEA
ncbi:hypothetical protein NDU88_002272 [Pleurodeles waltl]|uniref:Uncharacterized protein n=1 Tax=Pleurodeles waltl TaxID=8319 RepID=A0AAV7KTQ3_PLEWA|nr:hypothetical protein NDU88_002272 [Pleurodeles waltl]